MAKAYQHFIASIISGLLLTLAHPGWPWDLGWLVWIGLVPLFWSLRSWPAKYSAFWPGFITGIVYYWFVFRWLWGLYPLTAVGIESPIISGLIILLIQLISAGGMALVFGLVTLLLNKISYDILFNNGGRFLLIAALFTLAFYFNSFFFGLLWFGPETRLGPHWTVGNLAYDLADNWLLAGSVGVFGIYGLVFLIIFVNRLITAGLVGGRKKPAITAVIILIIITVAAPWPPAGGGEKLSFAAVQTKFPTKLFYEPGERLDSFRNQLDLLNRTVKDFPEVELIVFPEATDFLTDLAVFIKGSQAENYFVKLSPESKLIISGARAADQTGAVYSRVFALDTKRGLVDIYDKKLLTPGGEFIPYFLQLAARPFLSPAAAEFFTAARGLSSGQEENSFVLFQNKLGLAPVVCSEIFSPGLTAASAKPADVIVGLTSSGIVRGHPALIGQLLAAARLRAVENGKPLIMAANFGRSYAIAKTAQITALSPDSEPRLLTGRVVLSQGQTWYNRLGDWPVLLVSGLMLSAGFYQAKKQKTC